MVRGVVNDELEVVQQQDVDACGGGDSRSVWRGKRHKWVRRRREPLAIRGLSPCDYLERQAEAGALTQRVRLQKVPVDRF